MDKPIYLLDGAQSTQLDHYVDKHTDHPLWVCQYLYENPGIVQRMHEDYLKAGSDIIATFTYQLSLDALVEAYNVSLEKACEIMKSSVTIAKTAWQNHVAKTGSKKKPLISGSIGPYGAFLGNGAEYTGEYLNHVTVASLIDFHRPRVKILLDAGVDFLCFETLSSKIEALALLELLQEFPNAKAWIAFTCKGGNMTANGENFGKSAAECWKKGKDQLIAIGVNCTHPNLITNLLKSARKEIGEPVPFVTYCNSGEIFDSNGWTGNKQDLGLLVPEWQSLGVKYVGGCCRTDEADIRRMRKVIDKTTTTKNK